MKSNYSKIESIILKTEMITTHYTSMKNIFTTERYKNCKLIIRGKF